MFGTILLPTLVTSLLLLSGCAQAAPSQPPGPTTAAAPVATAAPKPTASAAKAAKPAAPTLPASGQAAPKQSGAAAKPTASPAPAGAAATGAASQPVAQASPKPNGAAQAPGSPPAVVATSAAVLPAVVAPSAPAQTAPKPNGAAPKPNAAAPSTRPADALGVAASAGSAAAVTTGPDAEATALCGQGAILSTRASQSAGRQATIAIAKVEASYQPNVRGQPTFLNDGPYPNHGFTAVIWGNDRRTFDPAPTSWQGKALCVTGAVEVYQQKPQITVNAASQLRAAR